MESNSNISDEKRVKMLNQSIPKLVVSMAIPTTVCQVITILYNTADTYFVSHIGKSAAAAVGVCFSLMSIIQAIGLGFGVGAGSIISRKLGAKKQKEANIYAITALFASFLTSILISIICLLNINFTMTLLGSSPTILPYSSCYGKIILIGSPIMCTSLILNVLLRSEGNAKYSMIGICSGCFFNIVLDPILIYNFNMGISGAAIATIISQFISLIVLLIPFLQGKSVIHLSLRYISKDYKCYALILKTGLPTICRQSLASIASAVLNVNASFYGDAAVAGITIANKIYLLVRNIVLGIGQGFQPVAGYNYGAKKFKRTKKSFCFSCLLGTSVSVVSTILIFLNSSNIIMWFQNDSDVVSIGAFTLCLACIAMPFMAYSTYVDQMYQCLGFEKTATLLACFRQGVFFIPAILLLPYFFGLTGIEFAQPLADILSFFACIPFQIIFFKKHLKS